MSESIEKGAVSFKILNISKEIWFKTNAKITGLHFNYKTISDKIDNLKILIKIHNVIKLHYINKFCDGLIDIKNSFSKEFV